MGSILSPTLIRLLAGTWNVVGGREFQNVRRVELVSALRRAPKASDECLAPRLSAIECPGSALGLTLPRSCGRFSVDVCSANRVLKARFRIICCTC